MYNEMSAENGAVRGPYDKVAEWINATGIDRLKLRQSEAEAIFRKIGITFAVYGEGGDPERLIPFDLIPRVFGAAEWRKLSRGIKQRSRALNAFLYDVYHRGEILRAGVIPEELVYQNEAFLPEMVGVDPPGRVYSHIVGVDIVRTDGDRFQVLEDNCRTPSGVSYMLENREIMMRMFPQLFHAGIVESVDSYPSMLKKTLEEVAPIKCDDDPTVVLLTPGSLNSAYYEHSFLADKLGVDLVEGRDLFVDDGKVFMRTTQGRQQVDVIYRRIDDDFLDPLTFRPDSTLGVPGLMTAYQNGTVTLANAVGTGVADDKAVYTYMPEIIRFFTGEEPILKNVPTWRCREPEALKEVLSKLDQLVVKEVGGSGGYGMLVGPASTKAEIEAFRKKLINDPDDFIAQPTLDLSTAPTLDKGELHGRHVDLRPFVLSSPEGVKVAPGGLTRVALKPGSLVVNSSQGGGTKDTWVLDV